MRVHFLGIGGSGASAAAAIARAQGYDITGCDLEPHNEFTTHFKKNQLFKGHSASHMSSGNIDILAVTPAIFSLDPNNSELVEAKKRRIPILTWQQFLGEYLTRDKFVIAVCGTHGKTTTTAMIAKILEDPGLDPTVLLGAINPRWSTNFRISRQTTSDRKYFVIEADEFNDNFLPLHPDISVVTNIEMDHPEYFKDLDAVKESFKKFLLQTKQTAVVNLSDANTAQVVKISMKSTPNGQMPSDLPAGRHGRGTNVQYLDFSKNKLNFSLKVPGDYNKLNAQAALQVGLLLGINPLIIRQSLSNYSGVGRRFEYIGDYHGAQIFSDFGHHPTEIKATMEAAREKFPTQKIWLIYEPHMFSRTKALFDDFVKVFKTIPVDKIIITDIYPSREVDTGVVSSQQLVEAVSDDTLVYHSRNKLLQIIKDQVKKGDTLFFMGAGDIDKIAKQLVK